jgi:hypothetical protein
VPVVQVLGDELRAGAPATWPSTSPPRRPRAGRRAGRRRRGRAPARGQAGRAGRRLRLRARPGRAHHHQAARHLAPPAADPPRLRGALRRHPRRAGAGRPRGRPRRGGCAGAVRLRQGHPGRRAGADRGSKGPRHPGGGRPEGRRFHPLPRRHPGQAQPVRVRGRGRPLPRRGDPGRQGRGPARRAGPRGAAGHPRRTGRDPAAEGPAGPPPAHPRARGVRRHRRRRHRLGGPRLRHRGGARCATRPCWPTWRPAWWSASWAPPPPASTRSARR